MDSSQEFAPFRARLFMFVQVLHCYGRAGGTNLISACLLLTFLFEGAIPNMTQVGLLVRTRYGGLRLRNLFTGGPQQRCCKFDM